MASPETLPLPEDRIVVGKLRRGEVILFQVGATVKEAAPDGRMALLLDEAPTDEQVSVGDELTVEFPAAGSLRRLTVEVQTLEAPARTAAGAWAPLLRVRVAGEAERVQRRQYFRMAVAVPLRFSAVRVPAGYVEDLLFRRRTKAGWVLELDRHAYLSATDDLSGGGLALTTDVPMARGEEFFFELALPDGPLRTAGRVVRGARRGKDEAKQYKIGIRFLGLEPREEARLVNLLFREEGRRRREEKQEEEA